MFSSFPAWLKTAAPWLAAGVVAVGVAGYFVAPKIAALYDQRPPYEEECLNIVGKITFNPSPIANPNGNGTVTITGGGPSGYNATLVSVHSNTPGVTVVSAAQQAFPGGVINGTWSLRGLTPGTWIELTVDAVDPGHGSKPGTDLCCSTQLHIQVPGNIDLGVQKTTSGTPSDTKDGSYKFTLQATNNGDPIEYANVVTISDVVPAGLQFTGASGPNWNCGPNGQYPLAAGAMLLCTYTGPVPIATGAALPPITVTATVVGKPDDTITNCAVVAPKTGSGYIDTIPANDKSCSYVFPQFNPHNPPPPFSPQCGMDVLFVVDESYSIFDPSNTGAGPNETTTVRNALIAGAHAFAGNGAQAKVIFFGSTAGVSTDVWGTGTTNWTTITPGNAGTIANTYTPATSPFGTNTNWEAALRLAKTELQAHAPRPTVVIFITDGKPNYYVDDNTNAITAAPVDGSGNTTPAGEVLSTNQAIPAVVDIYNLGIKIIGIGVGPFMLGNPVPNGTDHLHALLGNGPPVPAGSPFDPVNSNLVVSNDYGAITNILMGMAGAVCPKIQLVKGGGSASFGPDDFDAQGHLINTAKLKTQVSLTVTNLSAAPMTGVQVKDVLPGLPKRVNIGNPANYSQTGASSTNSGGRDTVIWNVPVALTPFGTAGASQTLTFDVTLEQSWVEDRFNNHTLPDGNTYTDSQQNFAQVTAVDQTVGSLMGNMGDDGPVTEIDESQAPLIVYTHKVCGPPTNCNTGNGGTPEPWLNVKKVYSGGGETPCQVGQPCTFTITVTGDYLGPVAFGDGVFDTTPGNHTTLNAGSTTTSVTTTESTTSSQTAPLCSSPTTAPWSCYAATFPAGATATSAPDITNPYTYTYTFSFIPTATGANYTNCFFAMPWSGSAPSGFSQIYNKWFTGPPAHSSVPYYVDQNGPYAGDRGDCADVHTAGQPQGIHTNTPPPQEKKSVHCDSHTGGPAQTGGCECPDGTMSVKGQGCKLPKVKCDPHTASLHGESCVCLYPSMSRKSKTSCRCPTGTELAPGQGCVVPHAKCDEASTLSRGGHCICRYSGMSQAVPNRCTCPEGSTLGARGCVPEKQSAPVETTPPPPQTPTECPKGTKLKDGQCVKKKSFFDNFSIGVGVGGGGSGGGGKPDGAGPHP